MLSPRMLGHNNGPTMEAGFAWRKHSWAKARADLLPNLPIEVLRKRVARAKELGLPYKTYASVRAASGHDVVGFLFSNNALRMLRDGQAMPETRAAKLASVKATHAALTHRPIDPDALLAQLRAQGVPIGIATQAPHFAARWSDITAAVQAPLKAAGLPKDGVLVIGDTAHERDWSQAGKLAGFLSSDQFFAPPP